MHWFGHANVTAFLCDLGTLLNNAVLCPCIYGIIVTGITE